MTYDADLALALRLADLADGISAARFRDHDLHVDTKPDRTPVTEADLAVERAIREALAAERPEDAILGEEFGEASGGGTTFRQWILDPIDGTANYLRGVPVWGTLIALAVDGKPVVGVVSAPALGRRWWAAEGGGAWTTDAPGAQPRSLRVSGVADLEHASVSFQSIAQWDDAGYLDKLIALTRAVWRDRAYGDMWSYMLLAEGVLDAVGEFDVKTYDLAALIPIVEEAGGTFTSVTGEAGPGNGSALASNGMLHSALLRLLG
ncbi:inositol monophosphatase family protein [Leifsonia sp. F6_8S_P_1B]|uniref:Inositol monophosphatase family protein n=1 Tax=Leifsonia williamsii TaxID=3035919 RepID=A0ABT8KBQ6_9MICO|nr:inositol monophosphatase family protein [Leifsonia williamsii]MDN4614888.1 inositol monophosphatase family protein [Leifsonia williamsii]